MKAFFSKQLKGNTFSIMFTHVEETDIGVLCALYDHVHRHYHIVPACKVTSGKRSKRVVFLYTAIPNKVIGRLKKHHPGPVIHTVKDLIEHIKICTNHYLVHGKDWGEVKSWLRHHLYRKYVAATK